MFIFHVKISMKIQGVMKMALKNFTFSLPSDLVEALKKHVVELKLPSVNHVVREALEARVVEFDREKLKRLMLQASNDPLFMEDLKECMTAFKHADMEVD